MRPVHPWAEYVRVAGNVPMPGHPQRSIQASYYAGEVPPGAIGECLSTLATIRILKNLHVHGCKNCTSGGGVWIRTEEMADSGTGKEMGTDNMNGQSPIQEQDSIWLGRSGEIVSTSITRIYPAVSSLVSVWPSQASRVSMQIPRRKSKERHRPATTFFWFR